MIKFLKHSIKIVLKTVLDKNFGKKGVLGKNPKL